MVPAFAGLTVYQGGQMYPQGIIVLGSGAHDYGSLEEEQYQSYFV